MPRQKIHIESNKKDRARIDVLEIIRKIIEAEFAGDETVILIAVGGPGGTGKTSFCSALADKMGDDSVVLTLDDYKTPRRVRQELNIFGAHPKANEMELICEHLKRLKLGESIQKPLYNPERGKSDTAVFFRPRKFVFIDGEISTYHEFMSYIDFSIFIDSDWRTQLRTRISRDIEERNYDKEKAIATFLYSNIKEFEEYGASSKNNADIHLYCESDYRLTLESMSKDLYNKYDSLFAGLYTRVGLHSFILAVLTPFTGEGRVDYEAFVDHLQYLYRLGVHRVLVGGMTGEFFRLTMQERRELLATACRYFPGYILYNITELSVKSSLRQIELAEDLGADGVAALPPLAPCGVREEEMITYFAELAAAARDVDLPLMIYNNPACCSNAVTGNVLKEFPELYIKDSAPDDELAGKSIRYFCGDDLRIDKAVLGGGLGFVSGAANGNPELYLELEKACAAEDTEKIRECQQKINEYIAGLRQEEGNVCNNLRAMVKKYLPVYPVFSR